MRTKFLLFYIGVFFCETLKTASSIRDAELVGQDKSERVARQSLTAQPPSTGFNLVSLVAALFGRPKVLPPPSFYSVMPVRRPSSLLVTPQSRARFELGSLDQRRHLGERAFGYSEVVSLPGQPLGAESFSSPESGLLAYQLGCYLSDDFTPFNRFNSRRLNLADHFLASLQPPFESMRPWGAAETDEDVAVSVPPPLRPSAPSLQPPPESMLPDEALAAGEDAAVSASAPSLQPPSASVNSVTVLFAEAHAVALQPSSENRLPVTTPTPPPLPEFSAFTPLPRPPLVNPLEALSGEGATASSQRQSGSSRGPLPMGAPGDRALISPFGEQEQRHRRLSALLLDDEKLAVHSDIPGTDLDNHPSFVDAAAEGLAGERPHLSDRLGVSLSPVPLDESTSPSAVVIHSVEDLPRSSTRGHSPALSASSSEDEEALVIPQPQPQPEAEPHREEPAVAGPAVGGQINAVPLTPASPGTDIAPRTTVDAPIIERRAAAEVHGPHEESFCQPRITLLEWTGNATRVGIVSLATLCAKAVLHPAAVPIIIMGYFSTVYVQWRTLVDEIAMANLQEGINDIGARLDLLESPRGNIMSQLSTIYDAIIQLSLASSTNGATQNFVKRIKPRPVNFFSRETDDSYNVSFGKRLAISPYPTSCSLAPSFYDYVKMDLVSFDPTKLSMYLKIGALVAGVSKLGYWGYCGAHRSDKVTPHDS